MLPASALPEICASGIDPIHDLKARVGRSMQDHLNCVVSSRRASWHRRMTADVVDAVNEWTDTSHRPEEQLRGRRCRVLAFAEPTPQIYGNATLHATMPATCPLCRAS